jgi:hypothetical protein
MTSDGVDERAGIPAAGAITLVGQEPFSRYRVVEISLAAKAIRDDLVSTKAQI